MLRDVSIEIGGEEVVVVGTAATFQDFVHYELSGQDNIGLGDCGRIDDVAAIREAAKLAGADEPSGPPRRLRDPPQPGLRGGVPSFRWARGSGWLWPGPSSATPVPGFSSVRSADRIYLLDQGRVAEAGTHQELMALGARSAELFNRQASAYLDGHDRAAGGG